MTISNTVIFSAGSQPYCMSLKNTVTVCVFCFVSEKLEQEIYFYQEFGLPGATLSQMYHHYTLPVDQTIQNRTPLDMRNLGNMLWIRFLRWVIKIVLLVIVNRLLHWLPHKKQKHNVTSLFSLCFMNVRWQQLSKMPLFENWNIWRQSSK